MVRWSPAEVIETVHMFQIDHLDVRTITLGMSLLDCGAPTARGLADRVYDKICRTARGLSAAADRLEAELGVRVANRRISITPASLIVEPFDCDGMVQVARALDRARRDVGADFLGGYSALVQKGFTAGNRRFLDSLPAALGTTEALCGSVNVATTAAGLNMDAIRQMGEVIVELARATAAQDGIGCAKLVVFANAPQDNPFMAGAFHGVSEPEVTINVGVSGPGAVQAAIREAGDVDVRQLAEIIKKTAFKVTRVGELVGATVARWLGIPFGIVDISLAPTPTPGDSVGEVLQAMGVEHPGAPGTIAALAMLTDSVKKGGAMATSAVGGLSGAFIPVSEDLAMCRAVEVGALDLPTLIAMTAVCSVGLDMIALPGETPATTIAAIIADEAAIGVVNRKTTGVRLIPVPGKQAGDTVDFGGLLGGGPILPVSALSAARFIGRGGQSPPPITGMVN